MIPRNSANYLNSTQAPETGKKLDLAVLLIYDQKSDESTVPPKKHQEKSSVARGWKPQLYETNQKLELSKKIPTNPWNIPQISQKSKNEGVPS